MGEYFKNIGTADYKSKYSDIKDMKKRQYIKSDEDGNYYSKSLSNSGFVKVGSEKFKNEVGEHKYFKQSENGYSYKNSNGQWTEVAAKKGLDTDS